MDQSDGSCKDERNRQQHFSIYSVFSGRKLQLVLLGLSVSCLVSAFLICSQLWKMRLASHVLNPFYKEFKMVTWIYAAIGGAAFIWLLLDLFVFYPRIEKLGKQKLFNEVYNSNSQRSMPSDSSSALQRRTSTEHQKDSSKFQKNRGVHKRNKNLDSSLSLLEFERNLYKFSTPYSAKQGSLQMKS